MTLFTILFIAGVIVGFLCLYFSGALKKCSTVVSFAEDYKKCNLVILTLYWRNKPLNFIVDTGATACYISQDFIKENQIVSSKALTIEHSDFSGEHTTETNCVKLILQGRNTIYTQEFYTWDIDFKSSEKELGKSIHGILGGDFLHENYLHVDYNKYQIYTKKN